MAFIGEVLAKAAYRYAQIRGLPNLEGFSNHFPRYRNSICLHAMNKKNVPHYEIFALRLYQPAIIVHENGPHTVDSRGREEGERSEFLSQFHFTHR